MVILLVAACTGQGPRDSTEPLYSGFDTDAEGWTVVDFVNGEGYQTQVETFEPVWTEGVIQHTDTTHAAFFFTAPWTGDLSAYGGGTLEFVLLTDRADWTEDAWVVLEGAKTSLYAPLAQPREGDRAYHRVQIARTSWLTEPLDDAPTPEVGVLTEVLTALTALRISGEFGDGLGETTTLDDVQILPW